MTQPPRHRCPVCGSDDVRGNKMTLERHSDDNPFSKVAAYDFYCNNCRTFERKRDDEPGFDAWYARWWAPD